MSENQKYMKDDIVLAKEYSDDANYIKFKIVKATYNKRGYNESLITYVCNKLNKNGTLKQSTKSWIGAMTYSINEDNILKKVC